MFDYVDLDEDVAAFAQLLRAVIAKAKVSQEVALDALAAVAEGIDANWIES